jgi:predicted RNase H-like HicB family nuclease
MVSGREIEGQSEESAMVAIVGLVHGAPGAYGISFPDFQGCIAGGDTIDEALRRGRDALDFHVESMVEVGEALPKVRDIAEIRADPTFVEDFADALVAVVDVALLAKPVRVNISIDERLLERIDCAAVASGETRSGFIASAMRQRLTGADQPISAMTPASRVGEPVRGPIKHFADIGSGTYEHQKVETGGKKRKRPARRR